ncbi:MAG: hybrid sensor histidine kinase/response regulator, partial [Promethearchaeota archaeon]
LNIDSDHPLKINEGIGLILQLIGEGAKVDRISFFEYRKDNSILKNTFEWCKEGIPSIISKIQPSSNSKISQIIKIFGKNRFIDIPDILKINLKRNREFDVFISKIKFYQIKSILILLLKTENKQKFGFLGLQTINSLKIWDKSDLTILTNIADIFSLFLKQKQTEENLRQNEKRFQNVFHQLPFPIAISDNNENNIYVNPKFTEIFGYTIDEISTTEEWSKKAYPNKVYRNIIEAKLPDVSNQLTKPRINNVSCKDGTVRKVIFRDVALDENEFITIFDDVTEQETISDSLKKSQERFQKIVEYLPYPLIVSSKEGHSVYINPEFNKTFGYTLDDIPNNEIWKTKAYPDKEYLSKISKEELKSGRERKIHCKNGEEKIAILQDIEMENEDITFFQDITEQRKVEEAIRRKDLEYKEIVNAAHDIIAIFDLNNIVIQINPAVTNFIGYTQEEVIGHSFWEYVHPDFIPLVKTNIQAKLNGKSSETLYDIDLLTKDHKTISVEIYSRFLYRNKKMVGTLILARDITIRRRVTEERQRQAKIESIGLLAGGIAHDFNNILVSILGNIDLLKIDISDFSQEHQNIIKDLEKATFHARDLTKQLLTFSKGGSPLTKTQTINEIIKETANFITRGSKSKCDYDFEQNLPPVDIDADQINQVLNNIIINATQAMPKGGSIKISIKTENLEKNTMIPLKSGKYLKISIADEGTGIPKDIQNKIFDPYFTTKPAGNGLGLTMSYSIIRKHNGYLTFTSKKGEGTTFFIYLPVSKSNELISFQDIPKKTSQKDVESARILVLDDDESIINILQRIFKKFDIEMEFCKSGECILKKYQDAKKNQRPFDLVIMDLTIPGGMGGKDAIKILRENEPDAVVIVSSGYFNDPIMSNYKEHGFDDYLEKPYTIEKLKEKLIKWIH